MKIYFLVHGLLLLSTSLLAQNGKILSKEPFKLGPNIWKVINHLNDNQDSTLARRIADVNFYKLTYLSDGFKVIAYSAEPKKPGKYPAIITNRGGNREFGKWDSISIALHFGTMASWGYVVVGSQFRGNDGGEGKEEFGGKDVNDVLNLVPVLAAFPASDTSKIGMEGGSRGGMMTYLALKASCKFKAAVVSAGAANLFEMIKSRPEMETAVFSELIPAYKAGKEKELKARSAVFWADQMCKTTPLLIMHGSSDWRVPAAEAIEVVQKLYQYKHPTRFILFEGADHALNEFMDQAYNETKRHFDYYLRDGKKWPDMEKHGD